MKVYLLATFFALTYFTVEAQDDKRVKFNEANDSKGDFVKATLQYPQFITGKAFIKTGSEAQVKFNYSYLTNQIVFIDQKGDTLELANPENFIKIVIASDTFYYFNNLYVMQVTHAPDYNLFLKRSLKYIGSEKKGAYGTYSSTSSIETKPSFYNGQMMTGLSQDENRFYQLSNAYFIADKFNKFFPATKKGFLDLFWKYEKQIKAFLGNNSINFDKGDDLEKLLQYARTLDENSSSK